ncbi:MAG: thiamine phosphate synthase [Chloroflexi bacterium]|nr:thiamine phosphate synthase [Chloroflexota bacterium]
MTSPKSPALPYPALCLVTDPAHGGPQTLLEAVVAAVEGGANMVQLRDRDMPAGQLYLLALSLRQVTQSKALLLVNDRVDVALAAQADGVQLGEEALPVEAARRAAGSRLLIGRSVHSVQGAIAAQRAGADFLVVGAIFPTSSHPSAIPAGLLLLAQVKEAVHIPLLGIGGIDASNAAQVMAQGASGAAVISAILAQADPRAATHALKGAMVAAIHPSRVVSSVVEL